MAQKSKRSSGTTRENSQPPTDGNNNDVPVVSQNETEDVLDKYDDGYDDFLTGDEEDCRRLQEMTEMQREQEFYRRFEQRQMMFRRLEIIRRLELQGNLPVDSTTDDKKDTENSDVEEKN